MYFYTKKNAHFLTCPEYCKSYLSLESISNDKKCTEPYVHSLKGKQNLYVSNTFKWIKQFLKMCFDPYLKSEYMPLIFRAENSFMKTVSNFQCSTSGHICRDVLPMLSKSKMMSWMAKSSFSWIKKQGIVFRCAEENHVTRENTDRLLHQLV